MHRVLPCIAGVRVLSFVRYIAIMQLAITRCRSPPGSAASSDNDRRTISTTRRVAISALW